MATVYQIRNKRTGLFCGGGSMAGTDCEDGGKHWMKPGDVLQFLHFLRRDSLKLQEQRNESRIRENKLEARRAKTAGRRPRPEKLVEPEFRYDPDWEVVEYELVEVSKKSVTAFLFGTKGEEAALEKANRAIKEADAVLEDLKKCGLCGARVGDRWELGGGVHTYIEMSGGTCNKCTSDFNR